MFLFIANVILFGSINYIPQGKPSFISLFIVAVSSCFAALSVFL